MWRTVRKAIAAAIAIGAAACGGGGAPLPPYVQVGLVSIDTDPLSITVSSTFTQAAFIEIGDVDAPDPTHYYDPRDVDPSVRWHAPARVASIDGDTLVLDDGTRVRAVAAAGDPASVELDLDASADPHAVLVRLVLPISAGEPVYGFGESPAGANAIGGVREMQLRVDDTYASGLNETHVPVPLAIWPAHRVGLFVEDRRPAAFDVGAARANELLATSTLPARGPLVVHLFQRNTAADLLRSYVAMTAKPAIPPPWAFAPMQWRNVDGSSDDVRADAQMMRTLGIPGSTIWIDNPWQTGYNTFEFDETRFAGPAQLVSDLEALGYHVVVWSTPYADSSGVTAADFTEAASMHYLVTDDTGTPIAFPWQNGPGGMIDFSAPGATDWWRQRIARVTALGVKGFKLDFGEELVPELGGNVLALETHDGDSQTEHAIYARGYHDAYLGALAASDAFVITRAGTWGEQDRNTAVWPGDLDNDFRRGGVIGSDGKRTVGGLPAAIQCGLSLSISGYPFFGSDIGGFRDGTPTQEALLRWAEYAALGPIMQLGGGGTHNPWDPTFPAGTADVYASYARLHMQLVPYFEMLAAQAGADGTPLVLPTRFVYPDADTDDDTFLVGDALFVAPVVTAGATTRTVILPPGRWIDWWTGALTDADGHTPITVAAPLDTLPLWRNADTWIPMYARDADTLVPATDASVSVYGGEEEEIRYVASPTDQRVALAIADGEIAIGGGPIPGGYEISGDRGGAATAMDTFDLDLHAATAPASLLAPTSVTTTLVVTPMTLPPVADENALVTCPSPGCWLSEPGAKRLRIRALAGTIDVH